MTLAQNAGKSISENLSFKHFSGEDASRSRQRRLWASLEVPVSTLYPPHFLEVQLILFYNAAWENFKWPGRLCMEVFISRYLNLTFVICIQESAAIDLNRRRSTGGILKRQEEERIRRYKDINQPKSNMPDPKFNEKKELFNRRDQVVSITNYKIRKLLRALSLVGRCL